MSDTPEGNLLSDDAIKRLREDLDYVRKLRQNKTIVSLDLPPGQAPERYLAMTPCGISIASIGSDGVTPGHERCCLFKIKRTGDQSDPEAEIVPLLNGNGDPIRETVYNYYDEEIPPNKYFAVERLKTGFWTADKPSGASAATTTTSVPTTTTTQGPGTIVKSPYLGKCKFTWDLASKTWSEASNTCNTTTTTTSSTTTAAPTTTRSPRRPTRATMAPNA